LKRNLLTLSVFLFCIVLNAQERPNWIEKLPLQPGIYYFMGYGQGFTLGSARKAGINNAIRSVEISSLSLPNDFYLALLSDFEVIGYFEKNGDGQPPILNENEMPAFSSLKIDFANRTSEDIEITMIEEYNNVLQNGNYEYYVLLSTSRDDLNKLKDDIFSPFRERIMDGSLDRAIYSAANRITANIPNNISIVTVATGALGSSVLENFILEDLTTYLVRSPSLHVFDRKNLDDIRNEQNFQMSGEVDDNAIIAIGHFVGAEVVVTINITEMNRQKRLHVKVLEVKTAKLLFQVSEDFDFTFGRRDGI
jgi:hypothetical protein